LQAPAIPADFGFVILTIPPEPFESFMMVVFSAHIAPNTIEVAHEYFYRHACMLLEKYMILCYLLSTKVKKSAETLLTVLFL
jgi:hypothetical protein